MRRTALLRLWLRVIVCSAMLSAAAAAQSVSVVTTFTPPNFPESIAIDKTGNIYVSMAPTGEIRKIAPDGTQSSLAVLGSGPFPRRLLGLAVDAPGNVYVALNDVPANRGVWRVAPDGTATNIAPLPAALALNGLAFDARGNLYVSDPITATIYRIARDGAVSAWTTDATITGSPTACGGFPFGPLGANGIAFNKHGDMFVLNTSQGAVARISVGPDGSAGTAEFFVSPTCDLKGADGLAFDNDDNMYVAVNFLAKIVRIDPSGNMTTIAESPADPLFFPSQVAFGTGRGERKQIYITNFAPLGGTPGIVTMDVGVPGRPLP